MRTRRYNYYALAQPGVLFNAPEGGDGGAGGGGDAAAQAAAAQVATDAAAKTATDDAAAKTAADAKAAAEAGKVEDLPAWAQKVIADTRKEAGDARTTAKQTAADEARVELAQTIGKALGLVKSDTAPTAEELAKEIVTAKDTARSAQVELAVYKASGAAGANPVALLDSRTFLTKVADLDPSKKDFDTKVADAIKDAVKDHPELKAAPAAARSGVNFTGGTGEGAKHNTSMTLEQAAAAHYGA